MHVRSANLRRIQLIFVLPYALYVFALMLSPGDNSKRKSTGRDGLSNDHYRLKTAIVQYAQKCGGAHDHGPCSQYPAWY